MAKKINKNGSLLDIGAAMIILFIFCVIILTGNLVVEKYYTKFSNNSMTNTSSVAVQAVKDTKDLYETRMDYVGFVLFMGLTLSILIGAWFVRGSPVLIFIYFILLVIFGAVSAILSFVWDKITTTNALAAYVQNLTIVNFLLQNFPTYIIIMGLMAMVLIFANPIE